MHRKALALVAVAVIGFGSAACGDDTKGSEQAYCKEAKALDKQDAPPDKAQFERLRDTAPGEIRADVKFVVARAIPQVDKLKHGDFSLFQDTAVAAHLKTIEAYETKHCGIEHGGDEASGTEAGGQDVTVSALEYKFSTVPNEVPAGAYNITLRNDGKELHEMNFVELKPGVTVDDVLKAIKEKGFDGAKDMVANDKVGGTGEPVEPGKSKTFGLKLEAGKTYAYACFVGSPPHAFKGMHGSVTVK